MRPKSFSERIRGTLPVLAVAALTLVAVYASVTVLGSMPYDPSGSPRRTPTDFAVPSDAGFTDIVAESPNGSPSATAEVTPAVTVELPSTPPSVIAMTKSATDPKGVWTASLRYPRFRPGTTPLSATMNQDIQSEIEDRIERYSIGTAAVKTPGKVNTLTGGFKQELLTPTLASFTLFWTDNTFHHTAGDPPVEQIETVNFDLGTGQRISLSDLFSDQPAALQILLTRSRELLREELGARYDKASVEEGTKIEFSDGTDQGTMKDGRNYSNWVLTKAGIEITWLEGEVADVAAGKPSVLISWSELKGVLRPTSPVVALAG